MSHYRIGYKVGDFVRLKDNEINRRHQIYGPYVGKVGVIEKSYSLYAKTSFCPTEMFIDRLEPFDHKAVITDKQYEKLYE